MPPVDAVRGRLNWSAKGVVEVAGNRIPCDLDEPIATRSDAGYYQVAGIRRGRKTLKRLLWPAVRWWHWWLVDGFCARRIGELVRQHADQRTVFLEVGCGNMAQRRYLPPGVVYNAMDIALSEFQVERAMRDRRAVVNIALASAYRIPLPNECVSLLVCNQVLFQVPQPERAISEFHRVLKPGGAFLCGTVNAHCTLYQRRGQHPCAVNFWTFDEFRQFIERRGFVCEQRFMTGWWIPLPRWMAPIPYHLPLPSADEKANTHFFYVFRRQVRTASAPDTPAPGLAPTAPR